MESAEPGPAHAARYERDRFVALAFCWADFLIEADPDLKIVFAAGPTESVLGVSPSSLIGSDLQDLIAQGDRALARQLFQVAQRRGRIENVTVHLQGPQGPSQPLSLAGYCLADLASHYFLAFRVNHTLPSRTRSGERPSRDPNTGLLEGGNFSDVAAARINAFRKSGQDMQVSLLSLDGFEALNERLSPGDQDNLTRAVAATVRASSAGGDSAAIIDAGKFSLLHEASLDIKDLKQQIHDFARQSDPLGQGVEVESATIGVDDASVTDEDLANSLLYTFNRFREAKGGDFSLASLSTNISTLMSEAISSVNAFRKIVATGDFDVAFQPIVHAATGEIHHYEGLCRFRGEMGEGSPYRHITFAEETGLIWQFDLAMAKKVIEWMAVAARKHTSVAVNVSGHSVGTFAYGDELHKLLRQNMWTRGQLLFEITESARMTDLDTANGFIGNLRNESYKVCLDDFGAGASSFQYLATLDVDVVKLDGSALRNAQRATKGEAFLTALARLCNSLGVETIAEMIDTPRGLDFVRKCGVQYVQGYLFGKPSKRVEDFDPLPQAQLFSGQPRRPARRL